jgi:subtilisin family serine protease
MRCLLLLLLCTLCSVGLIAQVKLNAPGNFFRVELKSELNLNQPSHEFIERYELVRIHEHYHVGVLAYVDDLTLDTETLDEIGVLNRTVAGRVRTFRVPLSSFEDFLSINGILYAEIAEPVEPFLHEALVSSRADSVHLGLGGLTAGYTGQGVIIAVIDWGFDYTHPMFYNEDLSELRLSRAWDQNKIIGTPPEGFDFGAEYVGDELLVAQSDTAYVFGPSSHGTHVGGIATGAGAGEETAFAVPGGNGAARFIGGAPDAEVIFISLKRDAPSFIDALNYVKNYAASVNKPFVVNMSFGSHLGPHDGNDLKNVGMDALQGPGCIYVGSAGNNGTGNFHLDRDFNQNSDTLLTVVNIHPSTDWGQLLSIWGSANSDFSCSIMLVNGNDETVFESPFYTASNEDQLDETIEISGNEFQIRVMATAAFTTNNKPNIRLEMRNETPHKMVLKVASSNSHVHLWSVARMANRTTNWGVNLTANYPGAVAGNTDYGPGEPAGCGNSTITVGAYRAERYQITGAIQFGTLASFSSKGPTVDGRTKPDISGPGVQVWSSVNSFADVASNPIEFEGNTYTFDQFSGTSMSSPMVAGVVALMLEANPQLNGQQVNEILKATARLDTHTGQIGAEGDLRWGWGKANALAAVLAAEIMASVNNVKTTLETLDLWPNPAANHLNVGWKNTTLAPVMVELFDLNGRMVDAKHVFPAQDHFTLDVNALPNGQYLVRAFNQDYAAFGKVIIYR